MPPLNTFTRTCVALSVSQLMTLPLQAATVTVNSLSDGTVSGCTLRDAIETIQTETDQSDCVSTGVFDTDDTIDFALPAGSQTIVLTEGSLSLVSKSLTIDGSGETDLTISGGGNHRIFAVERVDATPTVLNLNDLTLSGGSVSGSETGGAINSNFAVILLDNVELSGNTANNGGAIFANNGSVVLTNANVAGNTAVNNGGGVYGSRATMTLSNSSVVNNDSGNDGGGIYFDSPQISYIQNSTVSGNSAAGLGGGVFAQSGYFGLHKSTISGNSASEVGGGVALLYGMFVSTVNSTISGNTTSASGGGVYLKGSTFNVNQGTFSGNSAATYGGGIHLYSGSSSFLNTIVAGNLAGAGGTELSGVGGLNGLTSLENNIFGESGNTIASAFENFAAESGDIVACSDSSDATELASILSPLADNGGPTQTHALVERSPALDGASPTGILSVLVNDEDQREEPRTDVRDIGAYEAEFPDQDGTFVVPLVDGKVVIFTL